jgi:hypothetical protein
MTSNSSPPSAGNPELSDDLGSIDAVEQLAAVSGKP